MLTMRGPLAHSHFRLERWITYINDIVPQVAEIHAEYIHLIELSQELKPHELEILSSLLDYGNTPQGEVQGQNNSFLIIVTPKVGTFSAWSNKVSDLAHHCGLHNVQRIERGILYSLVANDKLTWGDEQAIAKLLHDPINEQVFFNLNDVSTLFNIIPQKSIQWIKVLENGKSALLKANEEMQLELKDKQLDYLLNLYSNLKRNPSEIELKMFANTHFMPQFLEIKTHDCKIERLTAEPVTHLYQYHLESQTNVLSTRSSFFGVNKQGCEDIRVEIALGKGAKAKVGFCGVTVSDLCIPGFRQPWEVKEYPHGISPSLEILLEKPIIHSQFNNEFGRPVLGGYCRTLEQSEFSPHILSGGYSTLRVQDTKTHKWPADSLVITIGFTASSIISSAGVIIENPEMQSRIQALINGCVSLDDENPILGIFPIKEGGLMGTLLSLIYHNKVGGEFEFQEIPTGNPSLSSLNIWCNEGYEGYVLIIDQNRMDTFALKTKLECTPFTLIGKIVEGDKIKIYDKSSKASLVDLPTSMFFEVTKINESFAYLSDPIKKSTISLNKIDLDEAVSRLLRLPCIADKSFLITIRDRTISGLVVRDPMVGPWQTPVADCMVIANDFKTNLGEALSVGERIPLRLTNLLASARIAIGEALTNIAGANISSIYEVKIVVTWSGNFRDYEEKQLLFEGINALGLELFPPLGIAISHKHDVNTQSMPLTVTASAIAPVSDVRRVLTPVLNLEEGETLILFIDLSDGQQRLGQSALCQVFNLTREDVPDLDNPILLKSFFSIMLQLQLEDKILAYHDRSDGGLFVTLCELAFASHVGLQVDISELGRNAKSILFNEELGAVLQIRAEDAESVLAELADKGLQHCYTIGTLDKTDKISIIFNEEVICIYDRIELQKAWSETSFNLQTIRDNPRCAKTQFELIDDREDPGLNVELSFNLNDLVDFPMINIGEKPRVAILREQGIYSHLEMAAAFDKAQFECIDVHMNDLVLGNINLLNFKGLAVCGGFSFGDVLGAGQGWTKRILNTTLLRDEFENYFNRKDTFTLGVSNGCQMLSGLKSLIPGAELWPRFIQNYSEQFEARWCLVEIQPSPSVLLENMVGSRIMVPVAHREGRVEFLSESDQNEAIRREIIALRYVDSRGRKTKIFPANPNGSALGITGLTNDDGRVLIMMPHPERAFKTIQYSWHPKDWDEDGPWLRMFQNARKWVN